MNRTRRVAAAIAALTGSLAIAFSGSDAAAKPASRQPARPAAFGIGAASATGFDGRAYLNFLNSPGGVATDHVAVVNLTTRRLRIAVYPVDTSTASDGTLAFAPRRQKALDAGSWIHVHTPSGKPYVVIPARTKVILPVDIAVPANAQPGDHAAGIVASITSAVIGHGGTSSRVPLEQRVALRTFFRISGPLGPKLEVQGLHVSHGTSWNPFDGFTSAISYTVRNTGNVRLGARQRVSISGLFGETGVTAPVVPVLLPGGTAQYTVRVPGMYPQLHMTARVSLRPIAAPGDSDPQLPTSFDTTQGFWAVPWPLLILVVLVLAAAVLVVRARRRRRPGRHSPPPKKKVREEQPV